MEIIDFLLVILACVFLVGIFFLDDDPLERLFCAVLFGIMAIGLCMDPIKDAGYKKGQLDAIQGVIKYRLEKQPDGSTEWKEIKK